MPIIEKTSEKTAPTEQIVNHAFVVSVAKMNFVITTCRYICIRASVEVCDNLFRLQNVSLSK